MAALVNVYDTPPDFNELALAVPAFAPFVLTTTKGTPTIDFKDDAALRALTSALLERDFRLKVTLPSDRLCPMIPGRLEYVLWMLSIVQHHHTEPSPITGIDIGTGSSAIYPLLTCRTLSSARMVGTEIDDHSLSHAKLNVEQNELKERVVLVQADPAGPIFPEEVLLASTSFDFTMCNPPFYASAAEVDESFAAKDAVCTGGTAEMITDGGEVAFVGRIVAESVALGHKIRWFSSLLGKLSSVSVILERLQELHVDNYTIKDLTHGRTKRWIVAWSFQPYRLPNSFGRSTTTASLAKLLPTSNSTTYHCSPHLTLASVTSVLSSAFTSLSLPHQWTTFTNCTFSASSNTWSRSARRKKARGEEAATEPTTTEEDAAALLACKITLAEEVGTGDGAATQVRVETDWERGADHAAFASLAAHLSRRLADAAAGVEKDEKGMAASLDAMDLS